MADDKAVHLGSPAAHLKELVTNTIIDARRADKPSDVQLACVLATCQSLTVQQNLLTQNAGGAFSGLMLGRRETQWQPDMAYLVLDPSGFTAEPQEPILRDTTLYVTCVIRNDVLVVNSPTKRGNIAFVSYLHANEEALEKRVRGAVDEASKTRLDRTFDFACVISNMWPVTAVVEMKGKSESPGLKLDYRMDKEKPAALVVQLNKRIASMLRGEREQPQIPKVFYYDALPAKN